MSDDYRSKLRSYKAKTDPTQQQQEEISQEERQQSPQTPSPSNDIEPFFPPSPFGRKRRQPTGDRFIPSRDRDVARDFQLPTHSKRSSTDLPVESTRRIHAFLRAELLDDLAAVEEYISPERNTRRVIHYTLQEPMQHTTSSSISTSSQHSIVLNPTTPITTTTTTTTTNTNTNTNTTNMITNTTTEQTELPPDQLQSLLDSPSALRFQTSTIGEPGRRILSSTDHLERYINQTPIKTLQAPNLQNDFYLNLIDWGVNDCLAVGLGSIVYLWDAGTCQVTKLNDFMDTVTSVNWSQAGPLLAIGVSNGHCYLYDTKVMRRVRSWHNHSSRVGSIAWRSNILTTGGRDRKIYHHDVRSPHAYFRKLTGHQHEVCGLKWNPEGTMLASGGNDNKLLIWDSHQDIVSHCFSEHQAAVKAISWSPHKRGLLASGGGTADMTIKLWNTIQGQMSSSHYVGSQVCNLLWSKKTNEIVSTHGFSKEEEEESMGAAASNSVIVWKADKMQKLASLSGHTSRVLYMSLSHDGSTVATGAADETIKFWDLFSLVKKTRQMETDERKGCLR